MNWNETKCDDMKNSMSSSCYKGNFLSLFLYLTAKKNIKNMFDFCGKYSE